MSLSDAFNSLLKLQSRSATFTSTKTGVTINILLSPSNYFRNASGPGEGIVEGREFVISRKNLQAAGHVGSIRRGDRIEDATLGILIIDQISEMYDLGGEVMGYRVRTS